MCSVIILFRPGHDWPVLWASNRDEMLDRPWLPPARHWNDRPEVMAGKDELAGGTWLGVNDAGLIAGILNRRDSLGPAPGKRSRGELVLDALDFADARDAVEMLVELDTNAYRPFNMVLADNTQAFWLRNRGTEVEAFPLTPGVTMVTASDANDPSSKRIRHFLPLWQAAESPDPDAKEWSEWEELLASREHAPDGNAFDAMNIISNTGFGTSSSSIIALPGVQWATRKPIWRFRTGRTPDWQPISL
jgi:uncharacterized protein with NRDE domain